jgi:hypothetical protein
MTGASVKDHVTEMVRDVLGPYMKDAGFRRRGRLFWRDGNDVCHVVTVVMSPWGTRNQSSFKVELGVFWHQVEMILHDNPIEKMPPQLVSCTFQIDLGWTVAQPPKLSWEVTLATDLEALGREVWEQLRDYGFRWLEYRSDLSRSLEWERYRRSEGRGLYSTPELFSPVAWIVFKVMLGKLTEAKDDLQKLAEDSDPDYASALAKKLRIQINQPGR